MNIFNNMFNNIVPNKVFKKFSPGSAGITEIDISDDSEYHTQTNNRFNPHGTCNTTASINALFSTDIDFEYPDDMQPEDYLTMLLESKEAWEKMRRDHPWAVTKGYHPRHVHEMLRWAINERLVKRNVDMLRMDASIQEILYHIAVQKSAVVVNGRFTSYGHIVTVVGLKTAQSDIGFVDGPGDVILRHIKEITIDDPYGNYHTGYRDQRGNNIPFSLKQFNWITKTYNNKNKKLAHFFNR